MKFRLMLKNLKSFITGTPMAFLVVLITEIIGTVGVIMTYGVVRNAFSEKEQASLDSRTFSYERYINGTGYIPWENSEKAFSDFRQIVLEEYNDEINSASIFGYIDVGGEIRYVCLSHYASQELYFFKDMRYEDFISDECLVSIDTDTVDAELGDMVSIGDKEYKVADLRKDTRYDFILQLHNAPTGLQLTRFQIFLEDVPTKAHVVEMSERLYELFGRDFDLFTPVIPELRVEQFNNVMFFCCAAAMIFIVITMTKVYMYVLNKRKNWLTVMKLCGCKTQVLSIILVSEILLVTCVSFGIGMLLCIAAVVPKMSEYYEAFEIVLTPTSYSLIFAAVIMLTVLISALRITLFVKRSVKDMRTEG